eukprot:CAMPEP_0177435498 /NCGR_PEP_ID=MMETSP0369-20130122/1118_1 /TAXON_ID=447022 ORGANISM="Scrippsiella hangoei-like, Strain SHHI-4" /NCGR_SAMPLE_ID=MMETSP0369 /ASSEMBLY_ACC=CAM_ASM_000364 /LENGTH=80 /DNA_ID=CAMNT_0018906731 /DNA_START=78 /DNA_END=317 /DNA_ORIENTATION=+
MSGLPAMFGRDGCTALCPGCRSKVGAAPWCQSVVFDPSAFQEGTLCPKAATFLEESSRSLFAKRKFADVTIRCEHHAIEA